MSASFDLPLDPASLAAARRGERLAQAHIYRTYERAVYSLARRMTHCPEMAADIMQNCFLQAFRVIHQFRGDAPFGHWLRRIAATEALQLLRRERRYTELLLPEAVEDVHVDVSALAQMDLERLLGLLPALPRAVLWLYHVEGYSHAEIAESCGKTISFSKSQLARAHQRLRKLVQPAAPDADAAPITEPA